MLTARAWWLLVIACLMLLLGMTAPLALLAILGLSLLLWLGAEAFLFLVRRQGLRTALHISRQIHDERGAVVTLWAGRVFHVRVRLRWQGRGSLPYVALRDAVPFGVEILDGTHTFEGELQPGDFIDLDYRIRCPAAGRARFEGVRVQLADPQGFFYHALFVRAPLDLPVLPTLVDSGGRRPSVKRYNLLPPPGIHRLRQPGSGSELLDLRDYLPGDPPRTIAWKVSARRDRLITKEFESEVPVRCTLFVDTSSSVRMTAGAGKELTRLVTIAAGVAQASSAARDLIGLCLFDEKGTTFVRPDRSGAHLTQLLRLLADAAARPPQCMRTDPEILLPLSYGFAREVYPELLEPACNAMPSWLAWLLSFPSYRRRRSHSLRETLYRHKRLAFFLGYSLLSILFLAVPTSMILVWYLFLLLGLPPYIALAFVFCTPTLAAAVFYVVVLLTNRRQQRLTRWRKQMAALLSVRYGLGPGGVEALIEDDDQLSLLQQRFLAEHQVPFALPLYDERGRYLFAAPEKVQVLARALLHAVGKGHDNELFVLLVDLLELDAHLEPLLRAVRVALARHHQVLLICPWPPGVPLPGEAAEDPLRTPKSELRELLGQTLTARFHGAYRQLRRTFGRIGVPVVCAASEEPVPLILSRLEELRTLRRMR